jgi:uncharacterized integral membrane protein
MAIGRKGQVVEASRGESRRPERARRSSLTRREQARTVVLLALAGLGVLFAVLNFDDVKVNWLFGTWSTPLIIVIAISFLLGTGVGWLAARRRRR